MIPTTTKKAIHIYSVEVGGWKKVMKINVSSVSSSAASSFASNASGAGLHPRRSRQSFYLPISS